MTRTRKAIAEFELVDHGIEHSQYFQGCGTAFTEFTDVATGIGGDPAEAIDDALESLAQMGYETDGMEARILAEANLAEMPHTPSVHDETQDDDGDCELYYHMSIRVK